MVPANAPSHFDVLPRHVRLRYAVDFRGSLRFEGNQCAGGLRTILKTGHDGALFVPPYAADPSATQEGQNAAAVNVIGFDGQMSNEIEMVTGQDLIGRT